MMNYTWGSEDHDRIWLVICLGRPICVFWLWIILKKATIQKRVVPPLQCQWTLRGELDSNNCPAITMNTPHLNCQQRPSEKPGILPPSDSNEMVLPISCTVGAAWEKKQLRGAWVAQSVEHPTIGFNSGHDLMGHGIKPCVGLHAEHSLLEILSLCSLSDSLFLSLN